jgi:hypothetical protein
VQILSPGLDECPADLFVSGRGGCFVPAAQGSRVGLDVEAPSRLRVDHAKNPDSREAQLPGVGYDRSDDLMAQRQAAQRGGPVRAIKEVRYDDDLAAPPMSCFQGSKSSSKMALGAGPLL